MKIVIFLVSSLAISFVLTLVWHYLWFYQGFFRPPAFLAPFIWSDGEASFDRVILEMFLILFLTWSLVVLAVKLK